MGPVSIEKESTPETKLAEASGYREKVTAAFAVPWAGVEAGGAVAGVDQLHGGQGVVGVDGQWEAVAEVGPEGL